jgi:prepilin-type N-terminal cleavage/methylation domain-containing protein
VNSTSHPDITPPSRKKRSTLEAGFTLIEVMIAIVLLGMISYAIYQATTQTYRYRAKIIGEGDFYGGIRLAMGLIDRDTSALFSPITLNPLRDQAAQSQQAGMNPQQQMDPRFGGGFGGFGGQQGNRPGANAGKTPEQIAEEARLLEELSRSDLGQLSDYWLPATDLTAIRPSRFVGTENRIQFISASHQRIYRDAPESEFSKIVYELREDKNAVIDGTRILVRVADPEVFDETQRRESKAKTYPLLSGVKSFSFRYFRKDKRAWENTWDTNREDMKGLYPDLIELTLEVEGLNRLSFKGSYMFKPEGFFNGLEATF